MFSKYKVKIQLLIMDCEVQCICQNIYPNLHQDIIRCIFCQFGSHVACYGACFKERRDTFICFNCRVHENDPFIELEEVVQKPVIISPEDNLIYKNQFFCDYKKTIELAAEKVRLMIFFTKLNLEDKKYIEWPSQNISVFVNGKAVNYDSRGGAILNKAVHPGINYLNIETKLAQKAIFAICHYRVKNIKDVAKSIVSRTSHFNLTEDESKKNFEILRLKDVELYNVFSIKDPITSKMIVIPCRGAYCKHLDCFDMMNFLKFYMDAKTDKKWRCFHCKCIIPWKDLRVDIYLHKIIRELNTKFPGKEINSICFDEQGNWKLQDEFSEEWAKINQKKKENHEKKVKETIIEETIMDIGPRKQVKKTELTIEECLTAFKCLYSQFSHLESSNQIYENVAIKMRELNSFKNFSAKKLYEFFEKAGLLSFYAEPQILGDIQNQPYANRTDNNIEIELDEILKRYSRLIKIIFAWAIKPEDLICITLYIITKNKVDSYNLEIALELLICFARHMELRKVPMGFEKTTFHFLFGNLLRILFNKFSWKMDEAGIMLAFLKKNLPSLFIPTVVENSFSPKNHETFQKIAELIVSIGKDYSMNDYIIFLTKLYPSPQRSFEIKEEAMTAKYFYYFFKIMLNMRDPELINFQIEKYFDQWDIYGIIRTYLENNNISLSNIIYKF